MEILNATETVKRHWLIEQMKTLWSLDEDDIIDGDCKDDACVEGNTGVPFIEVFNLCEQFSWKGITFSRYGLEIDLFEPRERKITQKAWCFGSDDFRLCDGILSMWFD